MNRWMKSRYGVRGVLLALFLSAVTLIVATPHLVEGQSVGERKSVPEALDVQTYSRVQAIRRSVGLTDEDLATLDLSESEAEAVLSSLLSWTKRNGASLDTADANERIAARELRETQRSLNMGPRDESVIRSMASKSEALLSAEEAQRTLRESGARQALALVRSDQRTIWETVNMVVDTRRLPSAAQQQLREDYRLARRGTAKALEEEDGRRITESVQLRDLRQARSSRLSGVQAASSRVLPVPAELTETLAPGLLLDDDGQLLPSP